ncbi:hypothetical protein FB446DRAFT_739535 [Lentinula raphanica]|nr:hypothetical protein FB446DRAFT_739535 [Lentinula raphanica]
MVHAQTIFAVVAFTFGATSLTVLAVPLPPSGTEAVTETGGDVLASVTMSHKPAIEDEDMAMSGPSGLGGPEHIERRQEAVPSNNPAPLPESPATSPSYKDAVTPYRSSPTYPTYPVESSSPNTPTSNPARFRDAFLAKVNTFKQTRYGQKISSVWHSDRVQGWKNTATSTGTKYTGQYKYSPFNNNFDQRAWTHFRNQNKQWGDDVRGLEPGHQNFNSWVKETPSGQAYLKALYQLPFFGNARASFSRSAHQAFVDKLKDKSNNHRQYY